MNQPLISIILPVYNSEPFLKRCLSSIAKQTYRNFEVLIVDDASPDDSLRNYAEFIQSFYAETNRLLRRFSNRNVLIISA